MRTICLLLCCVLAGCGGGDARPVLRVALTTTIRDSGLMDELVPRFEQAHNVRVDVIAAGTGNVLKLGEDGNVDVVWVHARPLEDAFMAAGHGVRREDVMYNTFELLGPAADPAGVKGMTAAAALKQIRASGEKFVSRADNSGTHLRELSLWQQEFPQAEGDLPAGLRKWDGYIETGQGMGPTLIIAGQLQGYVLSDRGTYLAYRTKGIDLVPLAGESQELRNEYGVMLVNPNKNAAVLQNQHLAGAFVEYLISPETQQRIADLRIDGESLFTPQRLQQQ